MKRTSKKLKTILFCTIFIILLILTSLLLNKKVKIKPITDTRIALNTVITITLYDCSDTSVLDGAFELCNYYETIFSRTKKTSELYHFNHSDKQENIISSDLAELIQYGLNYSQLSNGAFDISIAPISQLWDFTSEAPVVPNSAEINQLLPYVGYNNFMLDGTSLTKKYVECQLDLGGIAKGYIADKLKEYLLEHHVQSALINLGGNILCVGDKNGEPFHIGIQAPFENRNVTLTSVKLKDKSVVTSGIYERYFTENNKLYHHILNPKTGFPYENDLSSVTIISNKSVDGDALSTMCFAMGLEDGLNYINSHDDIEAIFVKADGEIVYSDRFLDLYY